ncbi:ATP-binding protein [Myceligenerans indicum]|uniref:ATP-binding protein n=1 Tax=Myceligenerans indicum TaxID=2593663 RepID=UPI00191DC30F|nr:ATP-binding protein [Myceligenerans indicum]
MLLGRRRVGKSRLAQEFVDRSGLQSIVFQATRGRSATMERDQLVSAARSAAQGTPAEDLLREVRPLDWVGALNALASAVPDNEPSIVILDEVPWLIEQDPGFEGALQTVWDRALSLKPVLLLLIGSNISVMESLQTYERPFFGRAVPMRLKPLTPGEIQEVTQLDAADAFDAFLVTGGFPEIVRTWQRGASLEEFLEESLSQPLTPLLASAALTLMGEFPDSSHARTVIEAIGGYGERTFSGIAGRAGGPQALPSGTLTPILRMLQERHVVTVDQPLSQKPDTKNKHYRIEDTYLRFWLALIEQAIPYVERGRGDEALRQILRSWTSWRGYAIEPVIREALRWILPNDRWPDTNAIGGWWNRQNNPEIDLVGATGEPVAKKVQFIGSIKWYDNRRFGKHEYAELVSSAAAVPGYTDDTPLVAVSRAGIEPGTPITASWSPEDLIAAWR